MFFVSLLPFSSHEFRFFQNRSSNKASRMCLRAQKPLIRWHTCNWVHLQSSWHRRQFKGRLSSQSIFEHLLFLAFTDSALKKWFMCSPPKEAFNLFTEHQAAITNWPWVIEGWLRKKWPCVGSKGVSCQSFFIFIRDSPQHSADESPELRMCMFFFCVCSYVGEFMKIW